MRGNLEPWDITKPNPMGWDEVTALMDFIWQSPPEDIAALIDRIKREPSMMERTRIRLVAFLNCYLIERTR